MALVSQLPVLIPCVMCFMYIMHNIHIEQMLGHDFVSGLLCQKIIMTWCLLYTVLICKCIQLTYCSHMYMSCILFFLQVTLPVAITPRRGHSAVAFICGPSFRVVLLFGGSTSGFVGGVISETTLLFWGECTTFATSISTQVSFCNTILSHPHFNALCCFEVVADVKS